MIVKGDSKRLPRKNLLPLNGTPMFLINLRKMMGIFEEVYVSTDDAEISLLAKKEGARIIDRPFHLCGETPDIAVYQHAMRHHLASTIGFIAVHADTPLVSADLIETARGFIEDGVPEVCTVHPFDYSDDYKKQATRVYGSVRGMSIERLNNYEDPYRPRPEVLLVDPSPEIETREDYDRVRCSISAL
jgi:CMP-N-acetylneuraminic acid synthetase